MSEVFYRKWRPKTFGELVGQGVVTQTLRRAIALGRVSHAYLFCGPRGTGKTSAARILAKAANCLAPDDGEPDNACALCEATNEGRSLDLVEIDAASNRGIDDIRNLSDKIHFTPNESRYRVYIIDEVHMLTEPAFNALLKTLEEPPGHAIFILATTEAHKVPLTIVSRCQRYDFRRISADDITAKLAELCEAEEVEHDDEALRLIARAAGGSLRDAENLLEQAVVSYSGVLNGASLRDMLEMGGDEHALRLVEHVASGNVKDGLALIDQFTRDGSDLRHLLSGVIEHLRGAMLLSAVGEAPLGFSEEITARLRAVATEAPLEKLVAALKSFGRADLRRDAFSPLPLELALVESCTGPVPVSAPAAARPAPVAAAPRPTTQSAQQRSYSPAPQARPASRQPAPAAAPRVDVNSAEYRDMAPATKLEARWREVVHSLRHVGETYNLAALLRDCKERDIQDGVITLKFAHSFLMERTEQELGNRASRHELQQALSTALDDTYEIRLAMAEGANGAVNRSASSRSYLVRAAQQMGATVTSEQEVETP